MSTNSNTFQITACDNELLLVAYQWGAAFEICTIKSGNSNAVNVTIPILSGTYAGKIELNGVNAPLSDTYQMHLPAGNYSLAVVGINWGASWAFTVAFNGVTYSSQNPSGDGVVWTPSVPSFTV